MRLVCGRNQRSGGSPRLCFAPKVRALAGALVERLLGRLPAGCRPMALKFSASGRKSPSIPPLSFEGRGDGGEGSKNIASPLVNT